MSTIWGLKAAFALVATLLLGHAVASLISPLPRTRSPRSSAGIRKTQGLIGLIAACLFGLALGSYDGGLSFSPQENAGPVCIDAQK